MIPYCSQEVAFNGFLPILQGLLLVIGARVVDQDVETIVRALSRRDKGANVCLDCDVSPDEGCGATVNADESHRFTPTRLIDIGHHDAGALASQTPCLGPAGATPASASDDCDLVPDFHDVRTHDDLPRLRGLVRDDP